MMDELERPPWEILSGYRVFAIDGDHLPESDKRLEPLRETTDAPPPGTVAARFDLQRELFDRAYLLEDAHAQEAAMMDRVIDDLQEGDCVVADRHYCVIGALRRITLELDKPTRNNDTVIHLLSNLPARIPATRVAEVYGFRWNEEQVDEVSRIMSRSRSSVIQTA